MKKILIACLLGAICTKYIHAQEQKLLEVKAEVRMDYQREYVDNNAIKPNSGFKGKCLNFSFNGTINDRFSYAYRQRLNNPHKDASFFDATDWVYLTYKANDKWSLSGGKQVVGIGGYEYDRAPIDLYITSEYWNNIPCFQFGVSVTYSMNEGKDQIMAQICESPFDFINQDLYAYNLMWYGSHGNFNTIWSVNMQEYTPGKFIYYIALGNEFKFGNAKFQFDFMNRTTDNHGFFFKDCSVMGELSYMVSKKLNLFGKVIYDVNNSIAGDYCVKPGTEISKVGAGFEYYPFDNNRALRFHGSSSYAWGVNTNKKGTVIPKQALFDVGVTWKVDILSLTNKIFN